VVVFCEAFHPSVRPVIHTWMVSYREENPGRSKYPPPSLRCRCLGKACPAPGGHPQDFDINISNKPNIYLLSLVFSHGQLYVAISRSSRFSAARSHGYMRNVVYREVLEM
jgi:hypothetical protein